MKKSQLKLLLFGAFFFVFFLGAAIISCVLPVLIPPEWNSKMSQAIELWYDDRAEAEKLMRESIKKADDYAAPLVDRLKLRKEYVDHLYSADDWKEGDKLVTEALGLYKQAPKPSQEDTSAVAELLGCRGFSKLRRHYENNEAGTGTEDMEESIAICNKALGENSAAATDSMALLSLMYFGKGEQNRAEETMNKAINAVENVNSARDRAWYVYNYKAQLKLAEGDYKSASEALAKSVKMAKEHEQDSVDECWDNFTTAMYRYAQPQDDVDLKVIPVLLAQGKFEQLEKLEKALQDSKAENSDGTWKVDSFYSTLVDDSGWTEKDYQKYIPQFEKWLKQNPKASTARLALAEAYISYAWLARGHGYSDTVGKEGWTKFESRMKQAKEVLDADPEIKSKSPVAYSEYANLAQGQKMDKASYMKMIAECHKVWPEYTSIDQSPCYFLLERWYGEKGEVEKFIESRADEIGGDRGDMLYAQLVWNDSAYFEDLFSESSPIKWPRVKAGFRKLFKEFPADMQSRVAFIEIGKSSGDIDGVASCLLENYKPDPVKAVEKTAVKE